jgi:hypothetical protein
MRHPCRVHRIVISSLILALAPLGASAAGTIEGTLTFWGDPGGGTQIEIGAHSDPDGPPDATFFVPTSGGAFSIPVDDGTYRVSALMARDDDFGEPRREDVLVFYDADGDGDSDTVTVSGGAVTGIDIDMGFVYVDLDATGGAGNGSSWTDAFIDLQDGIDLTVSGIEVWVAEGTYTPGASRSDSFASKSGVRVFGGFAGGETVRQERDWTAHPVILSGEIGGSAATDNCYHVVRAEASNPTAMFNGVTITRGYANGGGADSEGGGVRALSGGVTLANVRIIDNYSSTMGGGISTSTPGTVVAVNCSFVSNQAGLHGGGFYMDANSGSPNMAVNCVFTGNSAWRGGGIAVEGQIWIAGSDPVLVNLSLKGNSAAGEGGGIFTSTNTFIPPSAPVTIENSILWNNSSPTGPQISRFGTTDMPVVNYSIVQGGWAGGGTQILTDDPSFADTELRLNLDSPAIDAGDSTAVPLDLADINEDHWTDETVDFDLDLYWRFENVPSVPDTGVPDDQGFIVDMGAYEAWDPAVIFMDNFESGGTWAWDNVVGGS